MTQILPKQKHDFTLGNKKFALYPVYRGNGNWRIRLDIPGKPQGYWLPYESKNNSSIRCVDVQDCFRWLGKMLKATQDHSYNFKNFCEACNFPFDDESNNAKSWRLYDVLMDAYRGLRDTNNITLIGFFLGASA